MTGPRRPLPILLPLLGAVFLLGLPRLRSDAALRRADLGARAATADMQQAATAFLAGLSPGQRAKAMFDFDDPERLNWHFVPRPRRGLPLREMTATQQHLARGVLQAGLSAKGYRTASTIMELESVLREMGENPAVRDPALYFVSIFGTPSREAPWGMRVEGHHLSLNITVVGDSLVATTPTFFGANPAEVRVGTGQGLRALADEEDVARALLGSLTESQRARAVIRSASPGDIVTGNAVRVDPLSPVGIRVAELDPAQATSLVRLLDVYLGRMPDSIAQRRRAALERSELDQITFAWAGSAQRGEAHYYRIQGPSFLVEYDNSQNNANHVHTVWRDFDGDFGRDLLREHRRNVPHRD